MARRTTYRRRRTKRYTSSERRSYRKGFIAGRSLRKKRRTYSKRRK